MPDNCTLPADFNFTNLIKQFLVDKTRVDLMHDVNNALERASGIIISFNETAQNATVGLDSGQTVNVNDIIAMNGLFKAGYTCC